ncbi:MAG: 4Fe-4S ferredoxin [Chlorobi bacterium]|nr:4Fe-4S ferredoxin [Chlorobiota bacterium]
MEKENHYYYLLREHLNKLPIGYPKTESGVEIRILKYLFTIEEAKIALCLSLGNASIKKVKKRLKNKFDIDISEEKLSVSLDKMFMSGSISRSSKEPFEYSNAMLAIGMFENQLGHLSKEFIEMMHQYFDEGFGDEFFKSSLPQLRASPHMKAIVPEYNIDTYDNMREIVKNTNKTIQVANCVCKEGEALLGNPCKQTKNIEVCLMFDATSYLARNQARSISKKECLSILDRAEKEGLVLQPGNSLQPFCICLCCGCCCGVLTTAKKYSKPAELIAHNFYAQVDSKLCDGCSICYKRCQMDAISIEDKKAIVDLDRCIGCGLCVTTCKQLALKLIEKKKKTVPPKNAVLLYLSILNEKAGKVKKMSNMLKLLMGKQL